MQSAQKTVDFWRDVKKKHLTSDKSDSDLFDCR